MTNPAAKEIVTAMRDFEHALTAQPQSMFAPAWSRFKPPCNASVMFDPELSPVLHEKAKRTLRLVKTHRATDRLLYHWPFVAENGSGLTDHSADGDVLAVFVHDVTDTEAQAYVLTDRPREHSENTVQTDAPGNVWLNNDGRPVIRLSEHFAHSFVWSYDGEPTYVGTDDNLPVFASPARKFVERLRFGTLTGDGCDARLSADCGGRTVLLAQFCGMTTLLWEFCEQCYDAAIDTAKAKYADAVQAAWRNPPVPTWGIRG